MPLDPDKMRQVTEKSETLWKRFDALMERRKINDAAEDEDEAEEELRELAEEAREATPGSDLDYPDLDEPWFK
jgi:hypothetical protein